MQYADEILILDDDHIAGRGTHEAVSYTHLLLTILQSCADSDPDGQCHAQRELAELLHISPAAVANSLKSLEKGGYIRRERGRDARRNRVLLTPKGQQAVIGCQMAFETVSRRMLQGFSPVRCV